MMKMEGGGYKRAVIVAAMILGAAIAYEPVEAICGVSLDSLKLCKEWVSGPGAAAASPSQDCCNALRKADLKCLCGFKGSDLLSRFGIDPDEAVQLPVKCKIVNSVPC